MKNRRTEPRQPLGAHNPPEDRGPADRDADVVEESAMDSFPASDPPSWSPGRA